MSLANKTLMIVAIASLFHLMAPQKAYAYLDPATGSYIMQIIIAAVIGGLFAIKQYWSRITSFFKNHLSKKTDNKTDEV